MKMNMRKNKYMILLFLLFLFANVYAGACVSRLKEYADLIALCYPAGTLQESALEQLKENEEEAQTLIFSQIALWKFLGEDSISIEQNGREGEVSCYQMKGQSEALFGSDILYGRYFLEEEENACLLDQDTVRRLFGSDDVLGKEIQMQGKCFQITGVLRGRQSICVISGGREDRFDGVAVRKMDSKDSSSVVISRLEAIFGSTIGQKIDGQLYYVTACLFFSGVDAFLFVLAGILLGKERQKGWLFAAGPTAAAVALWLGVRCAAPGSDYLPTYWSDFGFFSRLFQEKLGQIQELAAHQEFFSWQHMFHHWQQAVMAEIFIGLLAAVCLLRQQSFCKTDEFGKHT